MSLFLSLLFFSEDTSEEFYALAFEECSPSFPRSVACVWPLLFSHFFFDSNELHKIAVISAPFSSFASPESVASVTPHAASRRLNSRLFKISERSLRAFYPATPWLVNSPPLSFFLSHCPFLVFGARVEMALFPGRGKREAFKSNS